MDELAAELGVARGTVAAVLRQLAAEAPPPVRVIPGYGSFVIGEPADTALATMRSGRASQELVSNARRGRRHRRGLYWLSRMTGHGTCVGGLLGPSLLAGAGFGLLVVPLQLTAWSGVAGRTSGWPAAAYRHALVTGFDRAFLVAAAISVLILVATITMIRPRAIPSRGSCPP